MTTAAKPRPAAPREPAPRLTLLGAALALIAVAAVAGLWLLGRDYYRLDDMARVDHDAHLRLRASGTLGHLYGIAGTLLILVNLVYLARKYLRALRGRGSLRAWMAVHVFAGLGGSSLIAFHAVFQARNDVASAAAWSLIVLVATGLVGRYMYALLPRGAGGEEESESALRARLARARHDLGHALAAGHPDLARRWLALVAGAVPRRARGPLVAVARLPLLPLRAATERRALHALAPLAAGHADGARLLDESRAILRIERQLHSLAVYRDLFLWWRALHRAFAIVMVIAMLVHVGVALYYGYRWLW